MHQTEDMPDDMPDDTAIAEVREALAQMRTNLLDLSGLNPLISFKHSRNGRLLRIVDELPDTVSALLQGGKALTFASVPEPDEDELEEWEDAGGELVKGLPKVEEWAEKCGILPDYHLPIGARDRNARRFVDSELQTLHYPELLESKVRNLFRASHTMVEETGTNLLHLVFGFLEWQESGPNRKTHCAPLYTLPVALEKGSLDHKTNTYRYTLRIRQDEVQFNASIAARLKDDFDFALPELDPDQAPESYLSEVEDAIEARFPNWAVHRWGTLAMLNFSRLLMYKDLNPENWPEDAPLDQHALVQAVIQSSTGEEDEIGDQPWLNEHEGEHDIDQLDNVYEDFPLVDVADSSQHSALIDAVRGKNLVIQGPPGTGKSQTITNLIAAVLSKGKTVLFVSEKLAALDVVKNRMERLGFGDLCLELHSHNTRKIGVVESLSRRLNAQQPGQGNFNTRAARHRKLVEELNQHADQINQEWGATGLTIREILVRCTRHWGELRGDWEATRIDGLIGETWTQAKHEETWVEFDAYADQLNRLEEAHGEASGLNNHPWRGVGAQDLDQRSINQIIECLREWDATLGRLCERAREFPDSEEVIGLSPTAADLRELSDAIELAPEEVIGVHWDHLESIRRTGLDRLQRIIDEVDGLETRAQVLGSPTLPDIVGSEDFEHLRRAVDGLSDTGAQGQTRLGSLEEHEGVVGEALQIIRRWSERYQEFHDHVEGNTPPFLSPDQLSLRNLQQLEDAVDLAKKLNPSDLASRSQRLLPKNLPGEAKTMLEELKELQARQAAFQGVFDLGDVRKNLDVATLKVTLRDPSLWKHLFRSDYRQARTSVRAAMHDPKESWDAAAISSTLRELEQYLTQETEFGKSLGWREALGSVFKGVDTDFDQAKRLLDWHAEVETKFAENASSLFADLRLNASGRWLLETNPDYLKALRRFEEVSLSDDMANLRGALGTIVGLYGHTKLPDDAQLSSPEDQWRKVLDYLAQVLPEIHSRLCFFGDNPPATLKGAYTRLADYQELREAYSTQAGALQQLNIDCFGGGLPSNLLPTQELHDAVAKTRAWCCWLDSLDVPRSLDERFIRQASPEYVAHLKAWNADAKPGIEAEQNQRKRFASLVTLTLENWSDDLSLTSLQERNAEALMAEMALPAYLTFLRLRGALLGKGFGKVCDRAEEIGIGLDERKALYEYLITVSLAEEIFETNEGLRRFDGSLHSLKIESFRACDEALLGEERMILAGRAMNRSAPQGERRGRVADLTEMALVNHEVQKQTRHIPLRQLLRRAGKSIQALKPCFMMGPRSVAQYLEPGTIEFDLLVIDEASQMRPADALGAVARCKQLVVVGDSKQLAPSSFFDRTASINDDEEEEFAAAVSKSILDAVAPVFARRQLRWHYRSRHPSLIAFSNRQFYDNRLMLFPSPHYSGEALGIRFNYLEEGVFENQVNTIEAQAVVSRVAELLVDDPEISLGVATMNAKQRDMIEGLLEARTKSDEALADAWEKNRAGEEALFIKNLENVQGDEREVMIISCTYGKNVPGGRVMQRFGPINSQEGGRRLNVLFTRSRARMELFSSMQSSDVVIGPNSSDGVRALCGMLRYAETGIIEGAVFTGREPDSDFEVAVAVMLQDHGYQVECQIGVAGFFIDLAVKHPNNDGEYVMGIECDGAAYHSSKSARDRDRIRQDVLESMGWNIHRIWSTDWFEDPEAALEPILEELSRLGPQDPPL